MDSYGLNSHIMAEQLNSSIQGIYIVTHISGASTVRWTFKDVFGTINII
jgi:hypothetical protein